MMRGIVISDITILEKNSFQWNGGQINPIDLRKYLLYWDKIDFPESPIFKTPDSPEIEFLKNVGILKRSKVNMPLLKGEMAELVLKCQLYALEDNNKVEKGCWSLGQPNADLVLAKEDAIYKRTLEIDLYRSLPVPTDNVSLQDILNFKEHRREEFLEFRSLMDELYLDLHLFADVERARVKSINQIQLKLIELKRVMDESKIKNFFGNVKIEVDYTNMIKNTIGAAVAGKTFGFPIALSGALGFASSFVKINSEFSLKPKEIPEGLKDYAYLYYISRDLS